jgi:pimeloyl-ACP methyl ester carboxylesterase
MNNIVKGIKMKTVILVHGLHMHSIHFFFMKKELKKDKNLEIKCFDYHSVLFKEVILDKLNVLVESIPKEHDIVLIGHSLGGLVSRLYLSKFKPQRNIKLITLGSPHRGSLVAKRINNTILKPFLGKSTQIGFLLRELPEWDNSYPLVSIAGIKDIGLAKVFAKDVEEPSDGTVFLSETVVENSSNHVIMENMHHSQLIAHPRAIDEVKKWI